MKDLGDGKTDFEDATEMVVEIPNQWESPRVWRETREWVGPSSSRIVEFKDADGKKAYQGALEKDGMLLEFPIEADCFKAACANFQSALQDLLVKLKKRRARSELAGGAEDGPKIVEAGADALDHLKEAEPGRER